MEYGYIADKLTIVGADGTDEDTLPDLIDFSRAALTLFPLGAKDNRYQTRTRFSYDAEGYLVDAQGRRGAWVAAGVYKAFYQRPGLANTEFILQVTAEHTEGSPLWVYKAQPLPVNPNSEFVMTQEVYERAIQAAQRVEGLGEDIVRLVAELGNERGAVGVNVKSFGAVGDGEHDDTAALNAAIESLPEQGGAVFIPSGTYRISSAVRARNALTINGEGSSASVIYQTNPNEHGISGTDVLSLSISNLRISGPSDGVGSAIYLNRESHDATNYVNLTDVYLRTFGRDGLSISNNIVSKLEGVVAESNGRYGFNLYGENGVIGTSTTLQNCYANNNVEAGFRIDTMGYMSFNSCAADHNRIGYDVVDCIGLVFNGCGAESNTSRSWRVTGGYGTTITGGWVYDIRDVAVEISGGAVGISVMGIAETSPQASARAFVEVSADSKATLLNVHNTTRNIIAPGSTQILNDVAGNTVLNGTLDIQGELIVDGIKVNAMRGSRWYVSGTETGDYTDVSGMIEGDIFLYPNSGDLFRFNGSSWVYMSQLVRPA